MKSHLRAVLFSLVVIPVAACGGDKDVAVTETAMPSPEVKNELQPITPVPTKIDTKIAETIDPVKPIVMPTTYVDALELGKQLAAKGEHSRAKEMLELAVKLDKTKADPHIELARLFIASGDKALAIRSANKGVKLAPESSQAYNTLGRAELARFNYDNAIDAFRQATELNADNVWAWNNLGYTYLQLKKYQDAADALVEATTRKGTTGYMWNNLGTAYEHLDELDDARLAFESGGKLGSSEAAASRKRLEGVETIAIFQVDDKEVEKTYDIREEMPEVPEGEDVVDEVEKVEDEVKLDVEDGEVHDEVRGEEPTVVEPKSPV